MTGIPNQADPVSVNKFNTTLLIRLNKLEKKVDAIKSRIERMPRKKR